jgi:hypothetical protein
MDLIYANENMEDIGVLHDYELDLAYGNDENDFELTMPMEKHCCSENYYIYAEGTEYGGIIDKIRAVSSEESVIYSGRTWHGILEAKILCPDEGADYLIVSGDAHTVLAELIERCDLTDLYEVAGYESGFTVKSYQFSRYVPAYTAIRKMLVKCGAKLQIKFQDEKIRLAAVQLIDYSGLEQFDSDQVELDVQKVCNFTNHVICLGSGELADRQVIHLYMDGDGNISGKKTFTGKDEITETYNYGNVESEEELRSGGEKILKEAYAASTSSVSLDADTNEFDVDDIVGSQDVVTGTYVSESITKKIVTMKEDEVTIEYKVGE